MSREYYNQRSGQQQTVRLDRAALDQLLAEQIHSLESLGWLQEAFGYTCVDTGRTHGTSGTSFESHLLIAAHLVIESPAADNLSPLSDAELFALLEVLVDTVSKPVKGHFHNWDDCGWHYQTFDQPTGRKEFVERLNDVLRIYGSGYIMTEAGEVELILEDATSGIVDEPLPPDTPVDVRQRIDSAVQRFRRGASSWEDRHAAVRDLGDAMESLRPEAHKVLTKKDEGDLFQLLNTFGIRHLTATQQTQYDPKIFLKWMFYYLLASIHACLELLERED